MFSTILSGTISGIQSHLVHVEVDLSSGLPCFVMVGRLGSEVREAGERVRIALKNVGITIPPMHIAVNFSPADIRKEGTGFDLPVAAGVLQAMGRLPAGCMDEMLLLGELGLNGEIKPVKGVLPIAMEAIKTGVTKCAVPVENVKEAAVVKGMQAVGISDLRQLIEYFSLRPDEREKSLPWAEVCGEELLENEPKCELPDFSEIVGQESVKRAAVIAACGFHHLLIAGPPGAGKTMIAKRMPGILPPMTLEESLEVSSLYSIAGLLPDEKPLITKRPFLAPHHTISPQALSGGGRLPKPGVISLAHRGVLFLDELPEFKRQTLDLLRQPLEDKKIQIARSTGSFDYPADVMLIGAMNPCPCGYYPDRNKCACTPFEIHNYLSHISGPILDRIDICIRAPKVEISQLQKRSKGESSEELRERVMQGRERQKMRYKGTKLQFNADLSVGDVDKYCIMGKEEKELLEKLAKTMDLSARAYHKMLKVARTIADLENSETIKSRHLTEAVCYRAGEELYGKS